MVMIRYRISSKSRRGEILFQSTVWCGDNSRAARFRGRRLQRSIRTRVHRSNNKPIVCMYNARAHTYERCRPFTMRRDFEGGVYWHELAETCGEISRAAGFRGAARFRGNTVATVCNFLGPVPMLHSEKWSGGRGRGDGGPSYSTIMILW